MPAPLPVAVRAIAVCTALVLAAASCGTDEKEGGAGGPGCGTTIREPLDPGYLVHTLGNAEEPEYASDPPTSGPHQPAPSVSGVVAEPISRPVQVGILERGDVLMQHAPSLPAQDVEGLEALAGDGVVVAPNPELPAPIVATAWTYKLSCESLDLDALRELIDERRGQAPDG